MQAEAATHHAAGNQLVEQGVLVRVAGDRQGGHQGLISTHRVDLVLGDRGIVLAPQQEAQAMAEAVADAANATLGALQACLQLQLTVDHAEAVVDLNPLVGPQAVEQAVVELEAPVDHSAVGPLVHTGSPNRERPAQGIPELLTQQVLVAGRETA